MKLIHKFILQLNIYFYNFINIIINFIILFYYLNFYEILYLLMVIGDW